MPLASGPGAPRVSKFDGYELKHGERWQRRCFGVVTRDSLEIMRANGTVTAGEYAMFSKFLDELEARSKA